MQITKAAGEQFAKMVKEEGGKDSGIRIFISGGGCCGTSFGLEVAEKAEKGDSTIDNEGTKLFLSADANEKMSQATIDYADSRGFIIKGMPSSSSCCG